jgi:hypothetical protein
MNESKSGKTDFMILRDGRGEIYQSEVAFEMVYIKALRSGESGVGYKHGQRVFSLRDGVEKEESRRQVFAACARDWREPSPALVLAMVKQFVNLTELSRVMDLSRATVATWKRTGKISFYHWRFLCELLGISSQLATPKFAREADMIGSVLVGLARGGVGK